MNVFEEFQTRYRSHRRFDIINTNIPEAYEIECMQREDQRFQEEMDAALEKELEETIYKLRMRGQI
jgi:hypothetical protein